MAKAVDDRNFWIVVCEGLATIPFKSGIRPMSAFYFGIEQVAREYIGTIASTHTTAILIKVADGVATVEK